MGGLARRTGCKVLLAQKAFSNYDLYPLLAQHLAGTEASGLFEARLARRKCPAKKCTFSARPTAQMKWTSCCGTLTISSSTRPRSCKIWPRGQGGGQKCGTAHQSRVLDPGRPRDLRPLRPRQPFGHDPRPVGRGSGRKFCLPGLLDGLHFHTLCEQDADALAVTLDAVAEKFGDLLPKMKWLNFGGGHHITRPGYDMATLEKCIRRARNDWGVTVYLEPGEACALNAGYLLTRVLDVVQNGDTTVAILDASAACHTPDVIEMPYRPPLLGAGEPGEKPCTVRLAGPTCLAGDVIGDYSFDAVPAVGDLLVFGDMAIYTTCKNNTFNGMPLPGIYARKPDGTTRKIVTFGYTDFKCRLGK